MKTDESKIIECLDYSGIKYTIEQIYGGYTIYTLTFSEVSFVFDGNGKLEDIAKEV